MPHQRQTELPFCSDCYTFCDWASLRSTELCRTSSASASCTISCGSPRRLWATFSRTRAPLLTFFSASRAPPRPPCFSLPTCSMRVPPCSTSCRALQSPHALPAGHFREYCPYSRICPCSFIHSLLYSAIIRSQLSFQNSLSIVRNACLDHFVVSPAALAVSAYQHHAARTIPSLWQGAVSLRERDIAKAGHVFSMCNSTWALVKRAESVLPTSQKRRRPGSKPSQKVNMKDL